MSRAAAVSRSRKRRLPTLVLLEWLGGPDVRLSFADGSVLERALPEVRSAKRARISDAGMGVDPGDGRGEFSATLLCAKRRGVRMVWYQMGE